MKKNPFENPKKDASGKVIGGVIVLMFVIAVYAFCRLCFGLYR